MHAASTSALDHSRTTHDDPVLPVGEHGRFIGERRAVASRDRIGAASDRKPIQAKFDARGAEREAWAVLHFAANVAHQIGIFNDHIGASDGASDLISECVGRYANECCYGEQR